MAEGSDFIQVQPVGLLVNENGFLSFSSSLGVMCRVMNSEGVACNMELTKQQCIDCELITEEAFEAALRDFMQDVLSARAAIQSTSQVAPTDQPTQVVITPPPQAAHESTMEPSTTQVTVIPPPLTVQVEATVNHQTSQAEAEPVAGTSNQTSQGAKNKPIGRGRGRPRKSQKETAVPPNPARNIGHEWNVNETNTLLDLYYGYMEAGIGPFKRFKTKISMWEKIASDINRKFMLELTRVQVESRFKTVLKRRTAAKKHNGETGETRMEVEYEDLLDKIKSQDDSIEPEVKRGVGQVEFSKFCKSKTTVKTRFSPISTSNQGSISPGEEKPCLALVVRPEVSPSPAQRLSSEVMKPITSNARVFSSSTANSISPSSYQSSSLCPTPVRKRTSSSESLLRCLENSQRARMIEREQQRERREEKENAREARKERHHMEKLGMLNQLCFMMASGANGPMMQSHHTPNPFSSTQLATTGPPLVSYPTQLAITGPAAPASTQLAITGNPAAGNSVVRYT